MLGERERLLDLVTDYCLGHGLSGVSLRSLAQAAGSNNRMLLYYFGSKEQLLVETLEHAGRRHPILAQAFAALEQRDRALEDRLAQAWTAVSAPEREAFLRLFFEVVGLAAQDEQRFPDFSAQLIRDWPEAVSAALRHEGVPSGAASDLGQEWVALWRGLQFALVLGARRPDLDRIHGDALCSFVARVRRLAGSAPGPPGPAS
jgi:AcrR family transcriptional regulator